MGTPVSGTAAPETSAILHLSGAAYADLGNALNVSFLGATPYTFEGWFSFDGLCPDSTLLQKPGEFVLGTKGATVFVQRTGQIFPLQTPAVLNDRDWFHIAASFDGTTLSLYINGLLSVSTSSPGPGIANQGQNFQLGATFQGDIDSFRIWNVVRTQAQIYTGQWTTLPPTSGMVAEYDCTQAPPKDVSGNNNPITLRAGAVSLSLTPAVNVTGAGYCEPVDDGPLVNPGGGGNDAYTILAWINLEFVGGQQCIFGNGDLNSATGIYLLVNNDGTVSAQRGGTSPTVLTSNGSLSPDQWYCIGYSYDGANQALYINGVLDSSAAAPALGTMGQGDLTIAAAYGSASVTAQMTLQGYVQFVSVWNVCLTAPQINSWMYSNPTDQPGVTADYSFAADSATNLQTNNPVGLAAGAKLVTIETPVTAARPAPPPKSPLQRPEGRALTAEQVGERQAFYTPERRAALLGEYRRALPPHLPRAQRTTAIRELEQILENLAGPDPATGFGRRLQYRVVLDGDYWSFRQTTGQGEIELARTAKHDLTSCQAAELTFVIATFDLFLGLFGLVIETSVATRFFNLRIAEGGFTTALNAILSLPLAASSVLKVIAILWDFGWFTAAVQLAINGMTWWDWITLIARVAAMVAPYPSYQKAYAVSQIIIGLWELATSFVQAHNACP
ncbi:MAG: hypothetical protein QOH01_1808 [Verrucomicrobiota bacterium]|jgi:hypothetical protein